VQRDEDLLPLFFVVSLLALFEELLYRPMILCERF
jgi:hypothetical protein